MWVVDFWPNLHVFSIFFTKSSEILCDYSYMIFSKSYNQVQIQNCQKIVSFWGKKNPQLQFFNKNIHNLNNFKVINGYPGTWVPTSQTDGYPSFTTRTWVYHHYSGLIIKPFDFEILHYLKSPYWRTYCILFLKQYLNVYQFHVKKIMHNHFFLLD